MPDFNTFSSRYTFRKSGTMGGLWEPVMLGIWDNEAIPSIDRIGRILILSFWPEHVEQSELIIFWHVPFAGLLQLRCTVDDPRLKAQYVHFPEVAEHIVTLLADASTGASHDSVSWQSFPLCTLSKLEIPESLKSYIDQMETWQVFFEKNRKFCMAYDTRITGDDYYVMVISGSSVKCCREKFGDTWEDCFNPPGNPVIEDNGIYWVYPDRKIVVIVPHECGNETLAAYYGYLDQFLAYHAAKKKEAEAYEKTTRDRYVDEKTKIDQMKERLRKSLIS